MPNPTIQDLRPNIVRGVIPPKAHNSDLHSILIQRLDAARSSRWPLEVDWIMNIMMDLGKHWFTWNEATRELEKPRVPAYRVQAVDNQIRVNVMKRVGRLIRARKPWSVLPATSDPEDEAQAAGDEQWLKYIWRSNNVSQKYAEATYWKVITGNACMKAWWNENSGRVEVRPKIDGDGRLVYESMCDVCGGTGVDAGISDPLTGGNSQSPIPEFDAALSNSFDFLEETCSECDGLGGTVESEAHGIGGLEVSVVSPFNIFWAPGSKNSEDAEYVIERSFLTVQEARRLFPDSWTHLGQNSTARHHTFIDFLAHSFGDGFNTRGLDRRHQQAEHIEIFRYYAKPSSRHTKGRIYTFTSDLLLESTDNPHPTIGAHPFAWFKDFPIPGSVYGHSACDSARNHQRLLNRLWSQVLEHGNLATAPLLLKTHTSTLVGPKSYPMPGEILSYPAHESPPSYLVPPSMQTPAVELIETMKNRIQEQFLVSTQDVSPSNISGRTLALIREESDEANAFQTETDKRSLKDLGVLALTISKDRIEDERAFAILGRSNQVEYASVHPAHGPGNPIDVVITEGDALPDSKLAKIETITDLMKNGLYMDKETGMPDAERALRDMDIGGDELDKDRVERENAISENKQMVQSKQPLPISEFDKQQVHFEEHERELHLHAIGSPERQALEQHAQQHKQTIMQAQQQALMASQQQIAGGTDPLPGLGGIPGQQAPLPPGGLQGQSAGQQIQAVDNSLEQFAQQAANNIPKG